MIDMRPDTEWRFLDGTIKALYKGTSKKGPNEPEPGQRMSPGLGILAFSLS